MGQNRTPVLTLTLNPALDMATTVAKVVPDRSFALRRAAS